VERVALGAIMGAVAFVVERRLLKAIRRKGDTERRTDSGKLELAVTAEQVDQ
jgi:HAMP domain-containing protein